MDYREKFYAKYVSLNTIPLYGKLSINDIKKQFIVWNKYFYRFLPQNKKASIIELGCGNGGLIYWLQNMGYANASGIDVSSEQIKYAKNLGIRNVNQANLVDFLKNKTELYDVIFMRDVIEHFHKDEIMDIFDMLYRALKKGGTFIIQTPNGASIFGGRYRYHDFTHEISFTENSLRQVMLISNFFDTHFHETRPIVFGIKSFFRLILWNFIKIILQFILLVETGGADNVLTQNIIAVGYKR